MKISNRKFYAGAFIVCILLAGGVSFYASSSPDGLEKVAEDVGFIETAKDQGFESARLSVGLAGLIGVAATALFAMGLFLLIRRKAPTQNR